MDSYTSQLEGMIEERNLQLMNEEKNFELLLYGMVPPLIASKLKAGISVTAEQFEDASLFYSDIKGFTKLASESNAGEIVVLLNELYLMFDNAIDRYNAYKVETIGDAYIVVSGVPVRSATHAVEIASLSLSLREQVSNFQVRHRPEYKLQLRIGLHSGSVVAGILGDVRPRYCLFGETMAVANDMQSTGLPMKIQCSRDFYEILMFTDESYIMIPRGRIEVEGKTYITYWLDGRRYIQEGSYIKDFII